MKVIYKIVNLKDVPSVDKMPTGQTYGLRIVGTDITTEGIIIYVKYMGVYDPENPTIITMKKN